MTVTLLDNVCTPCVRKPLWKQLRSKAAEKRVLLKRVDIRKEPTTYSPAVPFIVENDTAMTVEQWLNS